MQHPLAPVDPHLTRFLGPIQAHNPNGISIGSAFFAGLTSVTGRQTDHATRSVTIGHIYLRSTAIRPNNDKQMLLRQCHHQLLTADKRSNSDQTSGFIL